MITYTEKGYWLHKILEESGYPISFRDGVPRLAKGKSESNAQAIIDAFDPLPYAQLDAKTLVKEASAAKRLEYVTQAAGKDAEYAFKAQEAAQYAIDFSVGVFMQARSNLTGESTDSIAAEWSSKSAGWQAIGAAIAAIEDKSSQDIDAETDWQQCDVIAKTAIAGIEAI